MATLGVSPVRARLQLPANSDELKSKTLTHLGYKQTPTSSFSLVQRHKLPSFKTFTSTIPSPITTDDTTKDPSAVPQSVAPTKSDEKFDWYSHWYPLMPVCDLDKRVPHAKTVLGIDVVIWWNRNESSWKVFDDACPHRLAPLSEGRIDHLGRLQCVYHGWCFDGSGDCKLIPQAPSDGPPIHTSKKACVGAYPSTVQNGIVWFWPSSDPQYKDIIAEKKPPYLPEIDDPSYTCLMANRDLPYGYEVLIENFMDPAHVPYAHFGLMETEHPEVKADREGGRPIDFHIPNLNINGFTVDNQNSGQGKFTPPCLFYTSLFDPVDSNNAAPSSSGGTYGFLKPPGTELVPLAERGQKRLLLVFFCVPVSPGHSRMITCSPVNFTSKMPRWIQHIGLNLVVDSDLFLLHLEERRIMDAGITRWQKACFLPTKSDVVAVGFRKWLNNYAGGQVDWRGKFTGELPPTPPKEKLMDRYQSHVVNCSSCNAAHKNLSMLKVALQVVSFSLLGIASASNRGMLSSVPAKGMLLATALLCFASSKWLDHFIYKNFHVHDYNHALL